MKTGGGVRRVKSLRDLMEEHGVHGEAHRASGSNENKTRYSRNGRGVREHG